MSNVELHNGIYIITKKIASGGFGITYKAIRVADQKDVCIKEFFIKSICKKDTTSNTVYPLTEACLETFKRYKNNFTKEALTLQKLHHNNIVSVSDVFDENGTSYYVMDYIEGTTLMDIIPPKGFDVMTATHIINQLLDAVGYIHSHKVAHLDIKPSNILIKKSGEIVLIDFGGSKRYTEAGEQTSTSPLSTSEGFAPIELYEESALREFSPATDIYEIGATFYNLITGEIPPSAGEIMDEGNPIDQRSIPSNIKRVIKMAMEPGIKNRLQSIEEFVSILKYQEFDRNQSDDTVIEVTNEPIVLKDKGFLNKNKYMIAGVSVICIIILCFILGNKKGLDTYATSSEIEEIQDIDSTYIIKSELINFVAKENSKPHQKMAGIRIDSLMLKNNALEYFITVYADGKMIYDELKRNESTQKDYLIAALRNDSGLLSICKKLVMLNLNLTWNYMLENSKGSKISITLNSDELSAIKGYEGTGMERKRQQFLEMAKNINRQCPQTIDEGLTMIKCEFDDNRIIYYYNCSSEYYNYIVANLNSWKSDIASQFDDEVTKMFITTCAEVGVNIQYIYRITGAEKSIIITYNTLTNKFI